MGDVASQAALGVLPLTDEVEQNANHEGKVSSWCLSTSCRNLCETISESVHKGVTGCSALLNVQGCCKPERGKVEEKRCILFPLPQALFQTVREESSFSLELALLQY